MAINFLIIILISILLVLEVILESRIHAWAVRSVRKR